MDRGRGRRALVGVVGALMLVGAVSVVPGGTAAAAKPTVIGRGTVACTATGTTKYSPAFTTANVARVASIKANLTCSVGQTGNAAVQVVSGKMKLTSGSFTGNCLVAMPPSFTGTVKWKATGGKVPATNVTFTGPVSSFANPYQYGFRASSVVGSYAGQAGVVFMPSSTTAAPCLTSSLKKWSFNGGLRFTTASPVSAGGTHSCARTTTGAARCWGFNQFGQLGNGTNALSNVPVTVSGLGSGVSSVSAGVGHSCAVQNGAARCWGENSAGQLGNNSTVDSTVPVAVSGLGSGVVAISAAASHSCALLASGAARCWGDNGSGQLGNDSTIDSMVPVPVNGMSSGVVAISAGSTHTCAARASGAAFCWGSNVFGQLGTGNNFSSDTAMPVAGFLGFDGAGVVDVSSGYFHSCALLASGAVRCWGRNDAGQLGNGTNTDSNAPVAVTGSTSGARAVSAGATRTCVVQAPGSARCTSPSNVPMSVSTLGSGVVAVSAGWGAHSCAAVTPQAARCWGVNGWGELGNGTFVASSVPVAVSGLLAG